MSQEPRRPFFTFGTPMKYALIQLFAIPEEDPEMDTESGSPEQSTAGKGDPPKDPKQEAAEAALGGRRGAVVALDPRTGEVLDRKSTRLNSSH